MIATIIIVIIIAYLIVIGSLTYGFDKVEEFQLRDLKPKTKFSIVIPFRNEAENLPKLLNSIFKLNYPKDLFEVIFVDDESDDGSADIINNLLNTKDFTRTDNIKIIQNNRVSNSPKKDAITSAIEIANNEWIITSDADCVLPEYWLDTFDELIQTKQPNCIVAPVTYYGQTSFFNRFQTLDFLSLQGATIGGFGLQKPFLCNGANFAYQKSIFRELKGFEGNIKIASGDDIFLLEKLKTYNPKKVCYLKNPKAIVHTQPVSSLQQLINQRLRWASKTSRNPDWFSKLLGLVVFLANLVCLSLFPLLIFNLISGRITVSLLVIKLGIDFLLLFKTARFFKQENLLLSFLFSSILYPFFSVYIVILSLFKSYHWKGRTFKK
ncbi:glycosyltransferase family 2 protein [Winogradskyella ouciana]|uniref:Glycosyltransferase n=1 Tax=Winogradskyella ouciana TaxID=2608631 RepID=A0A7K1GD61_9FLAO|nr:glycosyltransferase [Winogradskyella ouciana]MTE26358.1 glycosyltransferase [Winogradskyella ouciana]